MQQSLNFEEYKIEKLVPVEADAENSLNLEKYHEQKAKIEKVEIIQTMKGYVNNKLVDLEEPRPQLLVQTIVLEKGVNNKGENFEIRAKEWFNLIVKDDGQIGWSQHEKGSLNKFLKAMKVKTPQELVGKDVLIKVVEKEDQEGQKNHQLRFFF